MCSVLHYGSPFQIVSNRGQTFLEKNWLIVDRYLVPAQAKWLSDTEKAFLQARLPANAPRSGEDNFDFKEIITALKDKRLWLFTLIWAAKTVGSSGLSFYLPTIVASLGLAYVCCTMKNFNNLR